MRTTLSIAVAACVMIAFNLRALAGAPAGSIIHDETVLVVHCDLTACSAEQVTATIKALAGEGAEELTGQSEETLAKWKAIAELGVTDLTITQSITEGKHDVGMMALGHGPQADVQAIKQWLGENGPKHTEPVSAGDHSVWTSLSKEQLETEPSAAKARQIAELIKAHSIGPVSLVFTPNQMLRDELAKDAGGAQGPMTMLAGMATTALRAEWMVVWVKPGEQPAAQIKAQMPDDYTANQLAAMVGSVLAMGQQMVTQAMAHTGGEVPDLSPVVAAMTPKVEGKMITMTAETASLKLLGATLVPALAKARKVAQKVVLANNMKQVAMAVHIFAADNAELPADLKALAQGNYIEGLDRLLKHPTGGYSPAFIYVKPSVRRMNEIENPSQTVLLVEVNKDGKPVEGGTRAYADGHVEREKK